MTGFATLRDELRNSTKQCHDALDAAVRPWALGEDYLTFLHVQFEARLPFEDWLDSNAPAGLKPPAQTPLLLADIEQSGGSRSFDGGGQACQLTPASFLGVAWALAGSSLGNRAMLARRRKLDLAGPVSFLSDAAMTEYWTSLLPLLDQRVDRAEFGPVQAGALAVFARFQSVASSFQRALAA